MSAHLPSHLSAGRRIEAFGPAQEPVDLSSSLRFYKPAMMMRRSFLRLSSAPLRRLSSQAAPAVRAMAQEWLQLDNNDSTRAEIQSLLDSDNHDELSRLLCKRIEFGTAGLRAKMGAGYINMNDVTVMQASQGLCQYLTDQMGSEVLTAKGVVVGYDARHNSLRFAHITARAFLAKGVPVRLFGKPVPTPFVPFAVSDEGCSAGVMVTASHNPKDDNGFKVYWNDACQISAPHDQGIASSILDNLTPWTAQDANLPSSGTILDTASTPGLTDPLPDVNSKYYAKLRDSLCSEGADSEASKSSPWIAYTAMHGVGHSYATEAFEVFGLPPFSSVDIQCAPDPDFPTVDFPNPEEGEGALRLAIEHADANGLSFIFANDPDADRLAVAEKQETGEWRLFTGNETATIFAWWQLRQHVQRNADPDVSNVAMVGSTVSTRAIEALAEARGFEYHQTLTGFKWMGRKAAELENEGKTVLLLFEEAIGYALGDGVVYCPKDKDGVSAAAVMGEITVYTRQQDTSLSQLLDDIYKEIGYFACHNSYYICKDPKKMEAVFQGIREHVSSGNYPSTIGGFQVSGVRDLTTGYDSTTVDNVPTLPVSASSQMITFTCEIGAQLATVSLRGSGTEPKLKFYCEVQGTSHGDAQTKLQTLHTGVVDELLCPDVHGLASA